MRDVRRRRKELLPDSEGCCRSLESGGPRWRRRGEASQAIARVVYSPVLWSEGCVRGVRDEGKTDGRWPQAIILCRGSCGERSAASECRNCLWVHAGSSARQQSE